MQEDNSQLVIEDGVFNGEDFKLIKFYFKHKQYVVIFTKVESAKNPADITLKGNELGLVYQSNSFEVKFDLVDNFESGHYYQKPASTYTFRELMALGMLLCNSIQFHFRLTGASAYYAIAENSKLKSFYDLLDKKCKNMVAFTVVDKLGSEGLGYEIRTTNYKN